MAIRFAIIFFAGLACPLEVAGPPAAHILLTGAIGILQAVGAPASQKVSNIKGDWSRQVTRDTPFLLTALENDMAAAEANMELLMISCNDPPSPAIPSPSSGVELLVATNADLQELLPHWVPDNSLDDESSHVKSKKQRRLGDKE